MRARHTLISVVMDSSPGRVVADALGVLIQRSFRERLYGQLTQDLGPGVDALTYPVLSGLARMGSRSAADLAGVIGLDRSGVSRRASRLEEAGLVARVPDPADSRAVLLVLTEPGKAAVSAMREQLVLLIDTSLGSWTANEAASFAESLRRFVECGPFSDPLERPEPSVQ
jgi:DNA-binding MarR family transcriptional regulator